MLSETSHDSGIYSTKNLFGNSLLKNTATTTTTTTSTAATTNKSNTTDNPTKHLTLKTWNFPDEHKLAKNTILETLPAFGKQWSVALQFKPTQYVDNMTTSILHMIQNGKRENTTLRIFLLQGNNKLIVDSVVTGGQNLRKRFTTQLALNVWTNIDISQRLFEGQYMFRILVDNNKLFSTENNKAEQFSNVSVYASSPWMTAQPGSIRNLTIQISKGRLQNKLSLKKVFIFKVIQLFTFSPKSELLAVPRQRDRAWPWHHCGPKLQKEDCWSHFGQYTQWTGEQKGYKEIQATDYI